MTQNDAPITVVSTGPVALSALAQAVDRAQAADRFARVVVITDHHDVARSVRHRLGMQGMINVTVQTGRRLAAELARPTAQPLTRLLESQAVRRVAETTADGLQLEPAGRHRLYRSLAAAFREMQDRPNSQEVVGNVVPDEMNRTAEALYDTFLRQVRERGYFPPAELPQLAVAALADQWPMGREPAVIYYLPRRMSAGDVQLAQGLLDRGKCQVIAGFTGDEDADSPARELLGKLGQLPVSEADGTSSASPLEQKAAADTLTIVATPDPEEEVRTVIRRIVSSAEPFHRTAIVYRQDNPYASLLRQELDFANVPYSGVDYRRLADTPAGRMLQGLIDLAAELDGPEGTIDRERLIEWFTSTPVRWPRGPSAGDDAPRSMTAPAAAWANLARNARAGGTVETWRGRLSAYLAQMETQAEAVHGDDDDNPFMRRLRRQVADLREFVERLAVALSNLSTSSAGEWSSASQRLETLLVTYRWVVAGESEEDLRRIDELVGSLSSLSEWGIDYSTEALWEAIREGLQSPVSERGRQVGRGVYVGPPTGIAGADYDVVYILGMVERQFPPRPRRSPWLAQNQPELDRVASLERYDFMASVAAAKEVVLLCPSATAERSAAYPSRWLIEAANRRHEQSGATGHLTYENLVDNIAAKPWLTHIRSREASLRELAGSASEPADAADYNLLHLVAGARDDLRHHPAIASNPRMTAALDARDARNGSVLSPWDGRVELDIPVVAAIGTREYPVSPSALETWATCPHKFFLSRVLRLSALPGEEEEDMSALERGVLVHRILERFVKERRQTDADLLELAEEEFVIAEGRGVTGYSLLWDLAKEDIRARLQSFASQEAEWLAGVVTEAEAEAGFGPGTDIGEVSVSVDGLGEVWFRGKIDRIDVVGDEVRVRDFKTGKPEPYFDGARGRRATRTLANGRALQLPVYAAAARRKYPDDAVDIRASYCFPLADNNTHGVAPYTEANQKEFSATLVAIVDGARRGIFPATPETAGDSDQERGNCTYCEFNRLCPVRRRQVWERKGLSDSDTVQPFNSLGGNAAIGADDDED
jgi:hypothetical protein